MGETELKREIDKLSALIDSLEEKAGITEAVKRARESGVPDKLKGVYFSVADADLKRKLILTTGKLDHLYLQKCDLDVSSAKEEVSKAIDKSNKKSWHLPVVTSLTAVVIGQWAFGLVGAIGGAIGGYFLGQWLVSVIKKEDSEAIEKAKHLLASAQRRNEASQIDPYLFSPAEQEACKREG
jgi:hypothetical protein